VTAGGPGEAPTIRDLNEARTRLTKLTQSSDRVEAGAARAAVRQLDHAIDGALANDLFKGDPKTVQLWRNAIGARRQFGKLFEGNDLIERLTERADHGGETNTLKLDPVEATNYLLGRQNLVGLGRRDMPRDIARLGKLLGHQSPEWNALRSEVFNRLVRSGSGPTEGAEARFSGGNFAKAWRKAQADYPEVLSQLYNSDERQAITKLAAVTERITKPLTGGDNASNTAVAAKKIATDAISHAWSQLGHIVGLGARATPVIRYVAAHAEDLAAARRIQQATFGAVPRRLSQARQGALGGYAGVAGAEVGSKGARNALQQ
jgi:hypothetical protein